MNPSLLVSAMIVSGTSLTLSVHALAMPYKCSVFTEQMVFEYQIESTQQKESFFALSWPAQGYCQTEANGASFECGIYRKDLEKAVARARTKSDSGVLSVSLNDADVHYEITCLSKRLEPRPQGRK